MSQNTDSEDSIQKESGLILEEEIKEPSMFRVLLHNDDYTTMEFVVKVLEEVFHKTTKEAADIMMSVHRKGMGVCGIYPLEIAEFRVALVAQRAHAAGFPLRCSIEKDS